MRRLFAASELPLPEEERARETPKSFQSNSLASTLWANRAPWLRMDTTNKALATWAPILAPEKRATLSLGRAPFVAPSAFLPIDLCDILL